ncbi:MAG TPA: hemerythrin domain-containing protein [Nocardioides sp.]|uniref:hemerythrin domain-containing protein n=1 Tax=Nocardioides sp. TaxID=35761 RepID=UPI002BC0FFA0|nr:hemerythrin domain-containing protein [Nocardioides sp.]HQR27042.1 hemerythrin domain-containing protein [Nocardioides sp.]
MTTRTQTPPAQLTLPGQTATPAGPLDMTGMYLAHHAFRRDLAAFAAAVPRTPVEDRRTWAALAARWTLFAEVLHHHHTGEDTGVWPALHERVDAAGAETLDAMEAEHAVIDPLLEACASGLRTLLRRPDSDVRAALAVRLVAARERLGEHLRHEETGAIPLLQQHLSPQEWTAIQEEHFHPARTLRQLAVLVPWLLEGVPDDAVRDLASRPGNTPMRVLWTLSRGRFARRSRAAFRYAG